VTGTGSACALPVGGWMVVPARLNESRGRDFMKDGPSSTGHADQPEARDWPRDRWSNPLGGKRQLGAPCR